jgi:hypothetical protein
MGLRKLSGLLLLLTMANLAAASGDLTCAKHAGGHEAAPESAAPGMDHHVGSESPEKEPCNVPARSDCCAAMTSCAPSVSLAVIVANVEAPGGHDGQPRSTDEVPLTRLIPPDPPPPKV